MSLRLKTGKTKGFLAALLLLGCFIALPRTAFAAWDGSTRDSTWYSAGPTSFTISSEEELAGLADLVNNINNSNDFSGITIFLDADLDLGGYPWTPIGASSNRNFAGTFDGGGHTIKNMTINGAHALAGFFGWVGSQGNINALGLEDINVDTKYPNGSAYVGGLAGENYGSITNCYATGTLKNGTSVQYDHTGGLTGMNCGSITNCYTSVDVTAQSSSSTGLYTGGLTGVNRGSITNCYATGTVTDNNTLSALKGGLVGYNYETITCGYFNSDAPNSALDGIGGDYNINPQESNIAKMDLADMQTQDFAEELNTNVAKLKDEALLLWDWDGLTNNSLPFHSAKPWSSGGGDNGNDNNGGGNNGNNTGGNNTASSSRDPDRDNTKDTGVAADYIYRVTFDTLGGSAVETQRIREGRYAQEPEEPTREGYIFTGWYTDMDCTSPYDFDKRVTGSFTLYAGWEAIEEIPEAIGALPGSTRYEPYISGYPDGAFRPESTVTRAEAAAMLYRLLEGTDGGQNSQRSFTDIKPEAWYYDAVTHLAGLGVISGYPDGAFRPESTITHGEFIIMAGRFRAVATADAIAVVKDSDITSGLRGNTEPADDVTRAQAVAMLNTLLGRESDGLQLESLFDGAAMPFTDVPGNHWAYWHIIAAAVGTVE